MKSEIVFPSNLAYLRTMAASMSSMRGGARTSLVLDMLYAACFSLAYDEGVLRQDSVLASMADRIPQDFDG